MYDIFYMSLLEHNNTKKRQLVDETIIQLKFEAGNNNKKYKVKEI